MYEICSCGAISVRKGRQGRTAITSTRLHIGHKVIARFTYEKNFKFWVYSNNYRIDEVLLDHRRVSRVVGMPEINVQSMAVIV